MLVVPGSRCTSVYVSLCGSVSCQGFGSVWSELGVGGVSSRNLQKWEGDTSFLRWTWKTLNLPTSTFPPGSSFVFKSF